MTATLKTFTQVVEEKLNEITEYGRFHDVKLEWIQGVDAFALTATYSGAIAKDH